jgi:putative spermidine/putrescine transport system substrate-binding protein
VAEASALYWLGEGAEGATMTARQCLRSVIVVAAAFSLLATPAFAQQKKITLLIWSSTWNGLIKPLAEQFTKDTGIAVDIEVQASSMEGLVKVQAMRGKPTADVWFTAQGVAQRAATDPDLLAPMPVAKLSNWGDVIPGGTSPTFAAAYYYPFGIVYRPDLVPGGTITSWEQLWGPGFENKLTLPVPSFHAGRMILVAALLAGGSIDNIEPGLEKLKQIRKNVAFWYSSDPQARKALAQGEVSVMVTSSSTIKTLADQGVVAKMVSPKPAPIIFEGVTILKGGKENLAAQFVNYVISPEWQKVITEVWNMGPVNKKVAPAGKFAGVLPKPGDTVVFDESVINQRLGAWTEKFNQAIGQ